jgi:hypothetical protein
MFETHISVRTSVRAYLGGTPYGVTHYRYQPSPQLLDNPKKLVTNKRSSFFSERCQWNIFLVFPHDILYIITAKDEK